MKFLINSKKRNSIYMSFQADITLIFTLIHILNSFCPNSPLTTHQSQFTFYFPLLTLLSFAYASSASLRFDFPL